jgi:hypothetical protein
LFEPEDERAKLLLHAGDMLKKCYEEFSLSGETRPIVEHGIDEPLSITRDPKFP